MIANKNLSELEISFYHFVARTHNLQDSDEVRTQKSILTMTSIIMIFLGSFWGLVYIVLGYMLAGSIPLCYSVISLFSLIYFFHSKRFEVYRFSQLLLILLMPFFMQWSLGGFVAGSAVMIWGLLAPLSAMFFTNLRQTVVWMLAYLILAFLSTLFDDHLSQLALPVSATVSLVFFNLNISCSGLTIFILMRYFSINRDAARRIAEEAKIHLEQLNHELTQLSEQKNHFFQNISHELRTPLTLLLNPLQILLQKYPQENLLQIAQNNTKRLLNLVNQLLEFQKITQGKRQYHCQAVELISFVKQTSENFLPLCARKQIHFAIGIDGVEFKEIAAHQKIIIYVEVDALEKVLFNYLSNALKYTPQQGAVSVQLWREQDRVKISVVDNGVGIAKLDQSCLFKVFSQVDNADSRRFEGTGLGLALVKELAEGMGGSVGVRSEQGCGSEFFVYFPLYTGTEIVLEQFELKDWFVAEMDEGKNLSLTPIERKHTGNKEKILVVDDLAEMRQLLRYYLRTENYEVIEAPSAFEALVLAVSLKPDLIITDWMMSGMTGLDLLRELKSGEHTKTIPTIMHTAKNDAASKREGLQQGADAYLAKPFNGEELLSMVKNLLRLKSLEKVEIAKAEEYKIAKIAAEQANKAKNNFLANASHELKTPLNAIIGYSELVIDALSGTDHAENIADLNKVKQAAVNLLTMINQILDLAKIEAGKMPLFIEAFDIVEVIRIEIMTMAPLIKKSKNQLSAAGRRLLPS